MLSPGGLFYYRSFKKAFYNDVYLNFDHKAKLFILLIVKNSITIFYMYTIIDWQRSENQLLK